MYIYRRFLIHSSANGHLGCFHVWAIVNSCSHALSRNPGVLKDYKCCTLWGKTISHRNSSLLTSCYSVEIQHHQSDFDPPNLKDQDSKTLAFTMFLGSFVRRKVRVYITFFSLQQRLLWVSRILVPFPSGHTIRPQLSALLHLNVAIWPCPSQWNVGRKNKHHFQARWRKSAQTTIHIYPYVIIILHPATRYRGSLENFNVLGVPSIEDA